MIFFLQLFDIPASRRRRANTIMNKRRTCRQRSFAAASCCPGKSHQTSAATHAGASHFAFFVGFFLPRPPRARRRTASANLSARGSESVWKVCQISEGRGGCGGRGGAVSLDLLQCAELVNQVGEVVATAVLRENSSRRLLHNPH